MSLIQVVSGQSCSNEGTSAGSESCDAVAPTFDLTLQDVVAIDVTNSLTASTDIIRGELDQRYLPISGTFVVNIFSITDYSVSVTNVVSTGTLIGTGNADTVVEVGNITVSNGDDGVDNPAITIVNNCAAGVIGSSTGETCQDVTTSGITLFNGGNTEGGSATFHTLTGQVRVDKDGLGNTSTDPGTAQQSFTFDLTFRVTEN